MTQVTGKGSIIALEKGRNCRKWQLRVPVGLDPITKKYRAKTRRFKGTKTEAEQELRAFINELESGIRVDTINITFGEYSIRWLQMRIDSQEYALGTIRKEDYHIRTLNKYLTNVRLLDLERDTIRSLYIALRKEGGLNGKSLTGATVHHIASTLNHILADAVESRIILWNPCNKKDKPRIDTKEKVALSIKEAQSLTVRLNEGEPEAHCMGILLALTCGLRRGEVMGLRWSDFDQEAGVLNIRNTLPSDGKVLKEPKTKAGRRRIPLDPQTLVRLNEWRITQCIQLLELGLTQGEARPIITNAEGSFMHPQNFARWWNKNKEKFGVDVSIHQLRHTFATLLVANGVDIVTAKTLMGHSDTKTLTEIYAHSVPENVSRATELIGGILYKDEPAEGAKEEALKPA